MTREKVVATDDEFDIHLERIIELWEAKRDTVYIADKLKIPECVADSILSSLIDGNYHCKLEEQNP